MKYVSMIIVAGIIVAAAAYFLLQRDSFPQVGVTDKGSEVSTIAGSPNDPGNVAQPGAVKAKTSSSIEEGMSEDEELIERMEVMRERRPNMDFDPDEVAAAMQRTSAWTPVKEKPKNLQLEPELLNDGRKFFNFDELKLETLVPGDTVKVNLEEVGQEYEVTIDRTEKHDYDSVSWYGHIETGDGQTYKVNFTKGGNLTVGGLSTPEGHFVIQSHGKTGWIASSATLFKIDPNQPDVMYPPGYGPEGKLEGAGLEGGETAGGDQSTEHQHDH